MFAIRTLFFIRFPEAFPVAFQFIVTGAGDSELFHRRVVSYPVGRKLTLLPEQDIEGETNHRKAEQYNGDEHYIQ